MRRKSGVITVEASFVVPLCIFAVITVIYFCFYLTDVSVATAVVEEKLSGFAYRPAPAETEIGKLRNDISDELKKTLVAVKDVNVKAGVSGNDVNVEVNAKLVSPVGFVKEMTFTVKDKVELIKQVDFIRNVRRVANLIDK